MTNLTTFSKVLICIAFAGFLSIVAVTCNACLLGCGNNHSNSGYYQQQPTSYVAPQPQVMYVTQPDGSQFFMNYMLWKSLMDNGGQTNVYNYYNQHRNDEDFQPSRQNQYREQDRQYQEQVKTQKSNGFGTKSVETNKSSGFGGKPVETKKSNGWGYTPSTSSNSGSTTTSTRKSFGFGSSSSKSVNTTKSGGFGSSKKSTSTSSSKGFGRRN